jgi:hypothetical protein
MQEIWLTTLVAQRGFAAIGSDRGQVAQANLNPEGH